MKSKLKVCPHCDALMMQYKHNLNPPLVEGLREIYNHQGVFLNVKLLDIDWVARANFTKLRFWGLIIPHMRGDVPVDGEWKITKEGIAFVEGKIKVHKSIWYYRNKFVKFDGELIKITDVKGRIQRKPDYVRESRPYKQKGDKLLNNQFYKL